MKALTYPTYLIRAFDSTRSVVNLHAHRRADYLLKVAYKQREVVGSGAIAFGKGDDKGQGFSAVVVTAEELPCVKHKSGKPPKVITPSNRTVHEKAVGRLEELGYNGREPNNIYAWSDIVLITMLPGEKSGLVVAAVDADAILEHVLTQLKFDGKTSFDCKKRDEQWQKGF